MSPNLSTLTRVMVITALAIPCLSGDACSGTDDLEMLASSLPSGLFLAAREARFEAKRLADASGFDIGYYLQGRLRFRGTFPADSQAVLNVSPQRIGGYPALFFQYMYGAAGRLRCEYLVLPKAGKFRVLRVSGDVRDVDQDGEAEVVAMDPVESWMEGCRASMAHQRQWPRILRLEPETDRLRDISDRFPDFYLSVAEDFREVYGRLRTEASPDCRRGLQQMIRRAETLARGPQVNWKQRETGAIAPRPTVASTHDSAAGSKIEIRTRMTRGEAVQQLGPPQGEILLGNRVILRFRKITVELLDGKVVDLKPN